MEETRTASIQEAYKNYLLEHGKKPVTVFAFAKENNMSEADFFNEFNSFEAIERRIWKDFFDQTHTRIAAEEVYQQYSVREKLLSFYYTLIEILRQNRSYVLLTWKLSPDRRQAYLRDFSRAFEDYARELVQEGVATREIANRPFLTERYAGAMRSQLFFVITFWVRDNSLQFEQTDAAIEKAVNAGFDLIGKSPLDSLGDFTKFLFQHGRNN
jgi:hypothetical protein